MRLMTFAAGAAVGYVLGTRAGRDKYEQIAGNARRLRDNPTAGQLLEAVRDLTASPSTAVAETTAEATQPTPSARPVKAASKTSGRTPAGNA